MLIVICSCNSRMYAVGHRLRRSQPSDVRSNHPRIADLPLWLASMQRRRLPARQQWCHLFVADLCRQCVPFNGPITAWLHPGYISYCPTVLPLGTKWALIHLKVMSSIHNMWWTSQSKANWNSFWLLTNPVCTNRYYFIGQHLELSILGHVEESGKVTNSKWKHCSASWS